jgi:hypothetical protein
VPPPTAKPVNYTKSGALFGELQRRKEAGGGGGGRSDRAAAAAAGGLSSRALKL